MKYEPTEVCEKRAAIILKYRGFRVKDVSKTEEMTIIHAQKPKTREKVIVLCVPGEKAVGVTYIRRLKRLLGEHNAKHGILVGEGRYTHLAREEANRVSKEGYTIELIPSTIPAFDVFKHRLVPKHEVLSKEEAEEVLKKYHAKPHQLPWIKASDPIAIILGAKPGDIVKVTSRSPTAGVYVHYRYVVEG